MNIQRILLVIFMLCTSISYAKGETMSLSKATFAGGCFWCMQPFFDRLKGVKETVVGYTGGKTLDPTYEQVSSGETGHAEAIEVTYDPSMTTYEQLLNIYWHNIDPTAKDAQFVDHGTQYRSAIFYHDATQQRLAEESKKVLAASGRFDQPIVTEIVPASVFYPAEEYHQKYYKKSSVHYEMYSENSGRHQFLDKVWGKDKQ